MWERVRTISSEEVVQGFQTLRAIRNDEGKRWKQGEYVCCKPLPVASSLRGKNSIAHGHYFFVSVVRGQGAHLPLCHHTKVGTIYRANRFKVPVDLGQSNKG